MTRLEFTGKIATLITRMIEEGEDPLLDYVKRSDEEQKRMFDAGKSKCDGTVHASAHQRGRAADIYFIDPDDPFVLGPPRKGFNYWHKVWLKMGGKPMIEWDKGHFEG